MLRRFHFIHTNRQSWFGVFNVPICIYNSRGVLKDRLDLLRDSGLAFKIRSVNLGNECLDHRRSRWNLADLDARTIRGPNCVQQWTKALGDRMALILALLGR